MPEEVKLPKWINPSTLALLGVIVTIAMAWSNLRTTQEFQNKRLDVLEARDATTSDTLHRLDLNMARLVERLDRLPPTLPPAAQQGK